MPKERRQNDPCDALGLHPENYPLGEHAHHTDVPLSKEDKTIGDAIAWYLGGLFIDVENRLNFMQQEMTSSDTWSRVARALRIHGLKIVNAQEKREKRNR